MAARMLLVYTPLFQSVDKKIDFSDLQHLPAATSIDDKKKIMIPRDRILNSTTSNTRTKRHKSNLRAKSNQQRRTIKNSK